jgi:hypothetical protein
MTEVLVVANQTLGGPKLLEAVRARAGERARFRLVVPLSKPSAGLVIYDDAVRDAAQVRIDLALSVLASESIEATGEVGDPDPFSATLDAVSERRPDEILISTLPAASSGWLRRDLIERIENATGLPVDHVVTDLDEEDLPFRVTLVVANRTSSGEELLEHLREKVSHGERHLFIAVVPQQDGQGTAAKQARARLAAMLDLLQSSGLLASGMIGDPDPYTAAVNALALFRVDDVVISTLPDERSGWLRADLIERVQRVTNVPVAHVVVDTDAATPARSG